MSLPRGKKFQVQPIEGVWHCLFWCNPRVPHDRSDALASVPADLSVLLPFIFIQLYVCHCLKMMFQCFSWKVCPMTSPKLQCAKSCEFQRCLSSSCWSGINTCYKLDRKGAKEKRYKIKKNILFCVETVVDTWMLLLCIFILTTALFSFASHLDSKLLELLLTAFWQVQHSWKFFCSPRNYWIKLLDPMECLEKLHSLAALLVQGQLWNHAEREAAPAGDSSGLYACPRCISLNFSPACLGPI